MSTISQQKFLKELPEHIVPHLSPPLQRSVVVRQPWRWLLQLHFGEPLLHYEISKVARQNGWELGLHCEARDKQLNRFLLNGFRRHLFEIKDTLGNRVEAEMWDRGWCKIYEVVPSQPLTDSFQKQLGERMGVFISCIHPIFVELRGQVRAFHR